MGLGQYFNGYSSALMGFDFADVATLETARNRFADYLWENGVDIDAARQEARGLNRSWEFATYQSYGKSFMLYRMLPWRGLMDMRPGSPYLKIFEKYLELRERAHHLSSHDYQRALSKYERRVNFAAIKRVFTKDAAAVDLKVRAIIREVMRSLFDLIERQNAANGISLGFAASVDIDLGQEFTKTLGDYLVETWRRNRDLALKELPLKVKRGLEQIKRFEQVDPRWMPDYEELELMLHAYAFCPTGEGGGIDNSCSPIEGRGNDSSWGKNSVFKNEIFIHGTKADFDEFDATKINKHGFPAGFYFSRTRSAWSGQRQKNILLVKLDIKNPAPGSIVTSIIQSDKFSGKGTDLTKILEDRGYDGVDRGYEIVAFYPSQIKIIKKERQYIQDENENQLRIYQSALEPALAMDYFQNKRPFLIKAIIDEDLKKKIRLELFEHLKGGRTMTETMGNLRDIFEPYVGDPEKIAPSGPGVPTPENILQAFRLENIVRTETATAMNQGRMAVADAAEDYIVGFELSAILDDRTTEICQWADGLVIRKEDPRVQKLTPPLHWQCRTIPVFITSDDTPVEFSPEADLDRVVRLIPKGFK